MGRRLKAGSKAAPAREAFDPIRLIAKNIRGATSNLKKKGIQVFIKQGGSFLIPTVGSPGPKGIVTLNDLILGIRELRRLIGSNELTKIAAEIYKEVMLPVLRFRWAETGGSGGLVRTGVSLPSDDDGRTPTFRKRSKLSDSWAKVGRIIQGQTRGSFRRLGKGRIGSFSLDDLQRIKIESPSRFNSVYMMLEFGTGEDALFPRTFKSGRTPFKAPPAVVSAFGAHPTWWYNTLFSRNRALAAATGLKKKKKGAIKLGKDPLGLIFGRSGKSAFHPRGVIFTARGIVKEIQQAQSAAQFVLFAKLTKRIRLVAPNFPGFALTRLVSVDIGLLRSIPGLKDFSLPTT